MDLGNYVGGGYRLVNSVLNGLEQLDVEKRARDPATKQDINRRRRGQYNNALQEITPLERELLRMPRAAAGTLLYRRAGMLMHYVRMSGGAYQTGDSFSQGAFMSTSFNITYKQPQGGQQLVMTITCSVNSRAHDIRARGVDAESEALFERGTRFLITSIKSAGGEGNIRWEMTELTGT